jgi:hypothetical protein
MRVLTSDDAFALRYDYCCLKRKDFVVLLFAKMGLQILVIPEER